jgi:polysaccharide export outer membrane protein
MVMLLLLALLQAAATVPPVDPATYVIGANDVLAVTVFNQAQLSGKFGVEADGTFGMPLVGRVQVGGLTIRGAEAEITKRLAAGYLNDPRVSVTVEQYRSQQVFVMGEVRQPGSVQFTGSLTLIEALARVGATTDRAGTEVVIVRPRAGAPGGAPAVPPAAPGTDSQSETLTVDLLKLQEGMLSQNVALKAGDTVFVPKASTVFVSGQVKTEGEYVIRAGMTVRQAIALAGGVTDRGSTSRIQIVRRVNGANVTVNVRLEDVVQAGDTIVVRERYL